MDVTAAIEQPQQAVVNVVLVHDRPEQLLARVLAPAVRLQLLLHARGQLGRLLPVLQLQLQHLLTLPGREARQQARQRLHALALCVPARDEGGHGGPSGQASHT